LYFATPQFGTPDWSFTDSTIENTLRVPGLFRRLDLLNSAV
jgi:hypothetical protein